jgi:hypothetical protein
MTIGEPTDVLISYIHGEYERNDSFKSSGEYAEALLIGFFYKHGNGAGNDIAAQMDVLHKLAEKGLIKTTQQHESIDASRKICLTDSITITTQGIEYAESMRVKSKNSVPQSFTKAISRLSHLARRFEPAGSSKH